jgi:hypothetical protein
MMASDEAYKRGARFLMNTQMETLLVCQEPHDPIPAVLRCSLRTRPVYFGRGDQLGNHGIIPLADDGRPSSIQPSFVSPRHR